MNARELGVLFIDMDEAGTGTKNLFSEEAIFVIVHSCKLVEHVMYVAKILYCDIWQCNRNRFLLRDSSFKEIYEVSSYF